MLSQVTGSIIQAPSVSKPFGLSPKRAAIGSYTKAVLVFPKDFIYWDSLWGARDNGGGAMTGCERVHVIAGFNVSQFPPLLTPPQLLPGSPPWIRRLPIPNVS